MGLFQCDATSKETTALPEGVGWIELYGAACLGGIGFTMSLFVTELAFDSPLLGTQAKVGILTASMIAAAWGLTVLGLRLRRTQESNGGGALLTN